MVPSKQIQNITTSHHLQCCYPKASYLHLSCLFLQPPNWRHCLRSYSLDSTQQLERLCEDLSQSCHSSAQKLQWFSTSREKTLGITCKAWECFANVLSLLITSLTSSVHPSCSTHSCLLLNLLVCQAPLKDLCPCCSLCLGGDSPWLTPFKSFKDLLRCPSLRESFLSSSC